MIRFYQGSGSGEIDLLDEVFPAAEWERLKDSTIRLLELKGRTSAAELLRKYPFVLHNERIYPMEE